MHADELTARVEQVLAPDGVLAQARVNFRPRESQLTMARRMAHAIAEGGVLVAEAGTGVGKTYAYLVPALLSGERTLISTASKALQDQLFARDLPQLVATLGLPLRLALLKGRGSYLCLHRLQLARAEAVEPWRARALGRIEIWAQATRSGDLAELPGLDETSDVIPLVTSTRDNCLGVKCPQFHACHVNLARREALVADVVVVNHHLFFADLMVRESGVAELLPSARTLIFDEAHQLNETGIQFLGEQFSTGQWLDLARDLLVCGQDQARGLADWLSCAAFMERAVRDLRMAVDKVPAGVRLRWADDVPERTSPAAWAQALAALQQAGAQTLAALDPVTEMAPDFVRLHERMAGQLDRLQRFTGACASGAARWVDVGRQVRLVESPLDIAAAMRQRVMPDVLDGAAAALPVPGSAAATGRAWIFTSATLGDDAALRWFTEPCGLTGADVLRVDSPFDYAAQAALYVPRDLPAPGDAMHGARLAARIAPWVDQLGGRTLVLTTSLRALRDIGERLQQHFADGRVEVLQQGQQAKRELMARFREADAAGRRGCVLVATASFWEGFDVPGEALQLVVIDKLPFPSPGDPLVQARAERLGQTGRNAFNDYYVPEAAVALKQGAGRLIRHEADRGVLVIGDIRLLTMGYGRRLLWALPPMRRLASDEEVREALAAFTRASTRASTS